MVDRVCVVGEIIDCPQDDAEALIRGWVAEAIPEVETLIEPVERTAVRKPNRKADKWRNQ